MTLAILFPAIDPVLVQFGPFAIRWYSLAYIAGILVGWWYMRVLAARRPGGPSAIDIDDVIVWATIGIILGGRLGYVLFYKPEYFLANPGQILAVWRGGMSFHGGLLGVLVATIVFVRRRGIALLGIADLLACAVPFGLFFGRIANFINGELWGRTSDVPWAMVFPGAGPLPRHPSQLYEAALEGVVMFMVLTALWRFTGVRDRPGFLFGAFLAGYGVCRMIIEQFREPDAHIGFLIGGATMGQILSLPMIAAGIWLMAQARPEPADNKAGKKQAARR